MVYVGKFFLFSAILFRLKTIQISDNDKYSQMSYDNRTRTTFQPANRGNIYDVRGRLLAENKNTFGLFYNPFNDKQQQGLQYLSKLIPQVILEQEIDLDLIDKPSIILQDINWKTITTIETNIEKLPGISVVSTKKRHYPQETTGAHVVGYVSNKSKYTIKVSKRNISKHTPAGISGIEKTQNDILRGDPSITKTEVNAHGSQTKELYYKSSNKGSDIVLSMDIKLQEATHKILSKTENKSGAIVVINVKNGEVLALCSNPSYNPNWFVNGITYDNWEQIIQNKSKPLFHRAISNTIPPGSVFKIVTAVTALQNLKIRDDDVVDCNGSVNIGNRLFKCWNKAGHGPLTIRNAIARSCNVFFYDLSKTVTQNQLEETSRKLGLNQLTGIEIEGEKSGLVPNSDWITNNKKTPWYLGDTTNSTIGQGYILTTPIQLAVLASRIATGLEIKPSIIHQEEAREFKPIDIREDVLETVRLGMFDVVNKPYGTAYRSTKKNRLVSYAGKTGSSQLTSFQSDKVNSVFIGYAPFNNPEIAISVVVEGGSGGGSTAAPIANEVISYYLKNIKNNTSKQ